MTPNETSGSDILEMVRQFFTDEKWRFEQIEDKSILRMPFTGQSGKWAFFAQVDDEPRRVLFFSVLESRVPHNRRQTVAECLTRANFGLAIGNFEMDFEAGTLRYKTGIDLKTTEPPRAALKALAYVNLLMMDKFYPAIMSVIHAETSPAEAIAKLPQPQADQ